MFHMSWNQNSCASWAAVVHRTLLKLNSFYSFTRGNQGISDSVLRALYVGGRYLHNGIDPPTVALPHASEARLPTNVPYLWTEYNITVSHFSITMLFAILIALQHTIKTKKTLAYLYCHVAFCYFPHVEAHSGNHVFTELARLYEETGAERLTTNSRRFPPRSKHLTPNYPLCRPHI